MKENCNSCNSDIWGIASKRVCRKCHPIILKINRVASWEYDLPETWKPIQGFDMSLLTSIESSKKFESLKREVIGQYESRIHLFKEYFSEKEALGLDLERMLNRISKLLSNANKDRDWQFHGYATVIDREMNPKSITFIYKQLLFILINKRFKLDMFSIHKSVLD